MPLVTWFNATTNRILGPRIATQVAATVIAATVPLFMFGSLFFSRQMESETSQLKRSLTYQADALTVIYDTLLQETIRSATAIASQSIMDDPERNAAEIYHEAKRMMDANSTWDHIALFRLDGSMVINTHAAYGDQLTKASYPPEWFQDIARTGKPNIYNRQPDPYGTYKGSITGVAVPVGREDGTNYVLSLGLTRSTVERLVYIAGVQSDLMISGILDHEHRIVARTKDAERLIGKKVSESQLAAMVGKDSGLVPVRFLSGQEVLIAFKRSPVTGWTAIAGADVIAMRETLRGQDWAMMISAIGSVATSFAVLVVVFSARMITRQRDSDRKRLAEAQRSLHERNVLLKEVYHRVKNNLQVIQSLLRMSSRHLEPDQRRPFETSITRISAMAKVHELLYRSPDLRTINFEDYLEDLARDVSFASVSSGKKISLIIDSDHVCVSLDNAIPLAFVAVELLTNAFKHAFANRDTGTITVKSYQKDGKGYLCVEDDGEGVPSEYRRKGSLGMRLVERLANQLNGTVEWPNLGESHFCVSFAIDVSEAEAKRVQYAA